ncbi:MAG: NAD(P)H-dependent oxidoreductase [Burkholderiaceae bacterium]
MNPGTGARRRVLVLVAHPALHRSQVNGRLMDAARATDGVSVIDLYAVYPRFDINVDLEQQRLRDHDVIIFQHPMFWYSGPALLKEWQDLVLEHGFAYGSGGTALHGKVFLCALGAGGAQAAYCESGSHHLTVRELLQPIEQMAALCGMHYLPPLTLFSAREASKDARLEQHCREWTDWLGALRDDRIDPCRPAPWGVLNGRLPELLRGDD